MKQRITRKVLSFILTAVLVVLMIPGQALAEDVAATSLEPGTYTVTANLYVPAQYNTVLGIDAYLTQTEIFPPRVPVADNAKLIVESDGTMKLQISELNGIFTLQQLAGCRNATVLSTERTDTAQYGPYEGRITAFTLLLKDKSGEYTFTDCIEYPTLLSMTWNVNLVMKVDFSSAALQYESPSDSTLEIQNELTDEQSNVKVKIQTTDETVKEYLNENADTTLNVSELTENSATTSDSLSYANITTNLENEYDSTPEFKVYSVGLKYRGSEVSLKGNSQATVSLPVPNSSSSAADTEAVVYQVRGTVLKEISCTVSNGDAEFIASRLGTFVVLNTTDNYKKIELTYPAINSVSFSYSTSTRYTDSNVDVYEKDGYQAVAPVVKETEIGKTYAVAFKNSKDYLTSTYNENKKEGKENVSYNMLTLTVPVESENRAYFVTKIGTEETGLCEPIYLVEEISSENISCDTGSKTMTIKILDVTDKKDASNQGANTKLSLLANGVAGENVCGDTSAYKYQSGYILVTDKNVVTMPEPAKNTSSGVYITKDCYYNAPDKDVEPWADVSVEGLEISGDTAARTAGTYTVTATLNSGNYWGDGTSAEKKMVWTIKPLKLGIGYSGGSLKKTITNDVDALEKAETGNYVNVETNGQVAKKIASRLTVYTGKNGEVKLKDLYPKVENWEEVQSEIKNEDGTLKAGLYTVTLKVPEAVNEKQNGSIFFTETSATGTLAILPSGAGEYDQIIEIPTGKTLSYTGREQLGVEEATGYHLEKVPTDEGYATYLTDETTNVQEGDANEYANYQTWLRDVSATEPGTYTVKVVPETKPNSQYWWSDGTKETKTITWTIKAKESSSSGQTGDTVKTVTANLYVPAEKNTVLGINAYLTNPKAPASVSGGTPSGGTGIPNTPVTDNAEVTISSSGKVTLELDVVNPVFTLQDICASSDDGNAKVVSYDWDYGTYGDKSKRIDHITFELSNVDNTKNGTYTYVFSDCEEYPTLLDQDWTVPLKLTVEFKGGSSSLSGGTTKTEETTDVTVTVKDDTATVTKINTSDLSSSKAVTLDVTDGKKGVTTVNLPADGVKALAQAKVPAVTVALSDAQATFDTAALTAVSDAAAGKSVTLTVTSGDTAAKTLNAGQKTAVDGLDQALVIAAGLTNSDGTAITDLKGGKATLTLPYTWDGKGTLKACYLDAQGNKESLPVTYANGKAAVTLTDFAGPLVLWAEPAAAFADVAADAYYADAVSWAVEKGVTTGTSATAFSPDSPCTRAQMVTFLWRAAGSPEPAGTENPFTDVKDSDYFYKAVLWAVEKGVTTGTSATTFGPNAAVTRGQTVTFLYRYAGSPAVESASAFTDVAADAYYADAVSWAAAQGITTGTAATTFSPDNNCTRAQIVTFLYRDLGK